MAPVRSERVNPSMLDVARHARVSIATVSNVINRPEKVSQATALRVKAAIDALGFVRNDAARSLALGTSSGIGMVLADLGVSLFVDMANGARNRADAENIRVLLANTGCEMRQQEEYLDLFDGARMAGMLLAPMEDSLEGILRMRSHGRQIVLLNYHQDGCECCTVLVDNEQVGYLAAKHLIEIGRTRLAFLAGRDYFQPVHDRRIGVKRAVEEFGGVHLEEIDTGGLLAPDGVRAAEQILMRRPELIPDGIIAVTDAIGLGLIEGIERNSSLRIGYDMSVVGCEDHRALPSGSVPMTTVRPPGEEMGEVAIELLLEEISGDVRHEHRTVVLQPTLVVRASTVPDSVPETIATV